MQAYKTTKNLCTVLSFKKKSKPIAYILELIGFTGVIVKSVDTTINIP